MGMSKIPAGLSIPEDLFAVIEIPAGSSTIKYEIEKESGLLFVDRFLSAPMAYPCNYGYINQTLALDGDPLDVLVMTPFPVQAGSIVRVRPIALLEMTDEAGPDAKLFAVAHSKLCPDYDGWKDFSDIPRWIPEKIALFFKHYKALDAGKWVTIGQWYGKEQAYSAVQEAAQRYTAR